MSQIKVSKQFMDDFNLVIKHYDLRDDEIEFLKSSTREDYERLKKHMSIVAGEIKRGEV